MKQKRTRDYSIEESLSEPPSFEIAETLQERARLRKSTASSIQTIDSYKKPRVNPFSRTPQVSFPFVEAPLPDLPSPNVEPGRTSSFGSVMSKSGVHKVQASLSQFVKSTTRSKAVEKESSPDETQLSESSQVNHPAEGEILDTHMDNGLEETLDNSC
jgi:hypothetical protein